MKQEIPFINALYAIGVILVVFGHSHYSVGDGNVIYNSIKDFIYEFHMPLFFWVSGFLLTNSNSIETKGYGQWALQKALRLLVPYFFLCLLFAVPKYYLEMSTFDGIGYSILKTLYIPRECVWGHLWFLPVLLIISLVFGLIKLIKLEKLKFILFCLLFVVTVGIPFIPFESGVSGWSDIKHFSVFYAIGCISFYFSKMLSKISIKRFTICIIFVLSVGISITIYCLLPSCLIVDFAIACLMIVGCISLSSIFQKIFVLSWLGKHNYTIYLYSWIFQSFAMFFLQKIGAPWYIALVIMFVIGLGIPIVIIIVYERFNRIRNKFFDLVLGCK